MLERDLMMGFASRTGLRPAREEPLRYLWTDAFAVCNYLDLYRRTEQKAYLELALELIDQVHRVLGRHRTDDPRRGWISGLGEEDGRRHPTAGGLRIGKDRPERPPGSPYDQVQEWDRDGQYFHYLTKWMHALYQAGQVAGDPLYHRWATELARRAHAAFCHTPTPGSGKRLYWKMSTDLSRPLVPAMGQHDPLDGLVTYRQLQAAGEGDLTEEIEDLDAICRGQSWLSSDTLGIGGLLFDACRMIQLGARGAFGNGGLLMEALEAALAGLEDGAGTAELGRPAGDRLPFRELGLAIGLKGLEKMRTAVENRPGSFGHREGLDTALQGLLGYRAVGEKIVRFWVQEQNRQGAGWRDHREINSVMLATCLSPESFLLV